jgi:hypothetical protein
VRSVYVWPVPLEVGDTLTLADGQRFGVVDSIELERGSAVDRLLRIASALDSTSRVAATELARLSTGHSPDST